jgi:hypothetical protein
MPKKRPTIKNERKYEALKDKGMSKEQAIGLRRGCIARRDDRTEEGSRTEGRQGDRPEAQIVDARG